MNTKCELLKFFNDTHRIVKEYHELWFRRETILCDDAKSRLRVLFIDALNAGGGGGNINAKSKAVETFDKRIKRLKGKKIRYSMLTEALLGEEKKLSKESIKALFDHLTNKKNKEDTYEQMGKKKAALFLRHILDTGAKEIFLDVKHSDARPYLIVPVDRVVRAVFNKYFNKKFTAIKLQKELITRYKKESMLCEDAWFWGHFTIDRRDRKIEFRKEGNTELLSLDTIIRNSDYIKKNIPRFVNILNTGSRKS